MYISHQEVFLKFSLGPETVQIPGGKMAFVHEILEVNVGLNAPFLVATVTIENTCVLPSWPEECGPLCKEFTTCYTVWAPVLLGYSDIILQGC